LRKAPREFSSWNHVLCYILQYPMEKSKKSPAKKAFWPRISPKARLILEGMKCDGTVFLLPRLWYNLWDFYCGTMRSKGARYHAASIFRPNLPHEVYQPLGAHAQYL